VRLPSLHRLFLALTFFSVINCELLADAESTFFSNLSIRDGLPSNIIASITQDQQGFIWIGTGSGLARYDGYHFKIFKRSEQENSLPSNELNTLLTVGDYLWVGTWNGLCKIQTRTFEVTRIDLGNNKAIRALYKGTDDNLWVGTGNGLIRYHTQDNSYELFTTENSGLSHNTIRVISADENNVLWVGTYDGLNRFDQKSEKFTTVPLKAIKNPSAKNHLILDIKPAFKNKFWIGTETGLFLLDISTDEATLFSEEEFNFSNEVIKCIYPAENGDLWLGTDFGLNIFNPQTGKNTTHFHNPQLPYSIANNVIWQIFEDHSGMIWLVTSNGLSKINKNESFYDYREVSLEVGDLQIGNQVKTVLACKDGSCWFGTQRGVVKIDSKSETKEVFDTSASADHQLLLNNVFALAEDSESKIWIGTAGGINIWDPGLQKMHSISSNSSNGLTSNYIAKFAQGPKNQMWVSAWEGGVFKIQGEVPNLKFTPVPGLEGSEKLVFGNDYLWAVTFDELYRVDPVSLEKTHISAFSDASKHQMIYCLYYSKSGELWAGTHNGLVAYDPKSDQGTFWEIQNGSDLVVSSIIEDETGNIWSTSNTSLQKLTTPNRKFEIYPLDEGLPLKSFYYGCAARAPNGDILFGGDNGYITFYPGRAHPASFTPPVYITSLEVNNQPINIEENRTSGLKMYQDIAFTNQLTLDYSQRSVAFEFSSLHYWQPLINVYSYRLEGLEKQWNYVSGTKNFAVYSSLPPGTYHFQVKATNNYGVESNHMASLKLTVKPPLYLSWPFIVLYFIVAGGMVFYALRFYSARVHLSNELKITRMEIAHAEEIEQTKEQFFTNISHELRTPISLILPPIHEVQKRGKLDAESNQLIGLAEKNSIRLLRLVNQILDFNKLENETLQIKASPVNLIAFCHDIFQLFTDQAHRHHIDFTFHSPIDQQDVWVDSEKIETVLFNLLSNAFKFTPENGTITMSIDLIAANENFPEVSFEIKVDDTGIGISKEDSSHIFERFYQAKSGKRKESSSGIGLTLAAEYTKLHHGQITVSSEIGKGTTFTIQLPLGKSHLPPESIHEHIQEPNTITTRPNTSQNHAQFESNLSPDKPLLLIVEDNDDIIEFICSSLSHQYNFVVAGNGEEGLIKAEKFMPELIISDIMMPVMDGLALCDRIKGNPKTSHMMVILLTAKSMAANRLEGIRRGADVYLTKPFEIDLLDAHISNLLKRKHELTNYFRNELITNNDQPEEKDNQDNRFLKKVMDVIEANVSEPEFTVGDLSQEIGMSSTHLYRRLKALTNHTAQDIIKKYRLKKASLLLQNNEGNVSETMLKVGFSSLSYFSKCFKEEYGMTPKEFQKQQNTPEKSPTEKA